MVITTIVYHHSHSTGHHFLHHCAKLRQYYSESDDNVGSRPISLVMFYFFCLFILYWRLFTNRYMYGAHHHSNHYSDKLPSQNNWWLDTHTATSSTMISYTDTSCRRMVCFFLSVVSLSLLMIIYLQINECTATTTSSAVAPITQRRQGKVCLFPSFLYI